MVDVSKDQLPVPIVSLRNSLENKTGSWKNAYPEMQEMLAPCRQACPIGNDIPRFINAIAEVRFTEALAIIREENPFPGITARSCSRFCMVPCNEKEISGKRISIADLEQAATTYGDPRKPNLRKANGYRVAVIGAGVAGLSAAYFLALLGYQVDLLDMANRPGGKLWSDNRYRRVPEEVIEKEINFVLDLIEFHPGVRFSMEQAWDDLVSYDAIYLAIDEDKLPLQDKYRLHEGLNIAFSEKFLKKGIVAFEIPNQEIKRWMITFAIRSGKRAAIAIDQALATQKRSISEIALGSGGSVSFMRYLAGKPSVASDQVATMESMNEDTVNSRFENEFPQLPDQEIIIADGSISRRDAVAEARRCKSCGVCNLCGVCVMSCPDMAIMEIDGEIYINYEYCKGCGICVEECPRGALRVEFVR